MRQALSWAFLAALAGALIAQACGGTDAQVIGTRVPGLSAKPGDFDDVEIDQAAHRLYAADRAGKSVDVFDISAPAARFVAMIALPAEPNGLALAPDLGRLFAGTTAGVVESVDTATDKVVGQVKTGATEIDLVDYGADRHLLFAATAAEGTLLTIDAGTSQVLATATIGKPVEQPRYDPADGMVYVSVPDLDALAAVDPKTGVIMKTLKLDGCIPRGLAIRPSTQTAVLACRQSVMAYDLRTGQSVTFAQVADGDIVQYFSSVDRFFVSSPHSQVPSVVGMLGGDPVEYLSSLHVNGGGNAAAYDQSNDLVYTTDPRQGSLGVMSFRMDGSRPVPMLQSLLTTFGPFAILVVVIGPLWWFLGRSADPIHREERTPKPAPGD